MDLGDGGLRSLRQDFGMRLDHVSYAVPASHLADEVQRIGATVGGIFRDGGRHPQFGTRNFVLPLAGGMYIEVVATLDHPAADRMPFGQAVKRRAELGGGWMAWVLAVEDIAPVEQRLGRPALQGVRHRPDGVDLSWKQLGIKDLLEDPQTPFFVQWLSDAAEHPSSGANGMPRITRLEVGGDAGHVSEWLGVSVDSIAGVEIDFVDDEPGLVAVHLDTRLGAVRLD